MKIHPNRGIKVGTQFKMEGDILNALSEITYINGDNFQYTSGIGFKSTGSINELKKRILEKRIIIV